MTLMPPGRLGPAGQDAGREGPSKKEAAMRASGSRGRSGFGPSRWAVAIGFVVLALGATRGAQAQIEPDDAARRLEGFDAYMEKVLADWNAPAVGVGVVVGDKLVFAKGYGYRDYAKKLPFTPTTLCPIASNTKLFTVVAAGLLVEDGKLTWDEPVRDAVPSVRFYDDALDNTVTLRDMLAHRTGITRHDMIWYKSDFSRKELFDRLRYLEPKEPLRQNLHRVERLGRDQRSRRGRIRPGLR